MTIARHRAPQTGALYVEAAMILPVLLLVVFASIFFFLLAARHFSLQMLANDIAKDISLSLGPRFGVNTGTRTSCGEGTVAFPPVTYPPTPSPSKLSLTTLLSSRYTMNANGCWRVWARENYLLATPPSAAALQVTLTAYPKTQWFDSIAANTPLPTEVAIGDYVEIQLRYPAQAILGGGIAMFGATPNISIVGTAIAVLERPTR
ncbi:MAG: hypothetical protein RIS36_1759 [Pseudomonadota bacterium]